MTAVRIFQPARSATQSGRARIHHWILEFEPEGGRDVEPLMGWVSSSDTRAQVRLRFETREDAVAYAKRNGLEFDVRDPHARRIRKKSYADRFAWNKVR